MDIWQKYLDMAEYFEWQKGNSKEENEKVVSIKLNCGYLILARGNFIQKIGLHWLMLGGRKTSLRYGFVRGVLIS